MSLEELRQEAEEEQATDAEQEVEELEMKEPQGDSEEESEEAESTEEVDELDFEDDEEVEQAKPSKPKPEEALLHKFTKERKKRQAAQEDAAEKDQEISKLREEIEALKRSMGGQAPSVVPQVQQSGEPKFPVMYEDDINTKEQYDQAVKLYFAQMRDYEAQQSQQVNQAEQMRKQMQEQAKRLGEDLTEFASQTKLNAEKATDAIAIVGEQIDSHTGLDGSFLYMMDALGKGASKAAYYLSRSPAKMAHVKELLTSDNTGLKAIAYLADLKNQAKVKTQNISKAPEPDEPLSGDGDGLKVSAESLRKAYEKETDFDKLLEIRKKARAAGITL